MKRLQQLALTGSKVSCLSCFFISFSNRSWWLNSDVAVSSSKSLNIALLTCLGRECCVFISSFWKNSFTSLLYVCSVLVWSRCRFGIVSALLRLLKAVRGWTSWAFTSQSAARLFTGFVDECMWWDFWQSGSSWKVLHSHMCFDLFVDHNTQCCSGFSHQKCPLFYGPWRLQRFYLFIYLF